MDTLDFISNVCLEQEKAIWKHKFVSARSVSGMQQMQVIQDLLSPNK